MSDKSVSQLLNPARKGAASLSASEIAERLPSLPLWTTVPIDGITQLQRVFSFRNFADALAFAAAIGAIAEAADHHPALTVEWGKVTVRWWTHTVRGLHANDFIMAGRTEEYYCRNAGPNA